MTISKGSFESDIDPPDFGHGHGHGRNHEHGHHHAFERGFDQRGFARALGMRFFRGRHGGGFEGRGGRVRRGGIKYMVLETLVAQPRHGYDIMEEFERRRGFRPSPGSIYPVLQMLEEGGFIAGTDVEGKRVYSITETGKTLYAERAPGLDDDDDEPSVRSNVKTAAIRLTTALGAARGASEAELTQIAAILDRARREILRVLAAEEL